MQRIVKLSVVVIVMSLASIAFAEQTVTLDNGRKVILKKDHTWQYVEQKSEAADSGTSAKADGAKEKPDADKTTKNAGFRKTRWGMSKKEVEKAEGGKPDLEQGRVIAYSGTVVGLDTAIAYVFVKDKLVRARYAITEKHVNDNQYLDDYATLKAALTKKYGKPDDHQAVWKNNLYRDDPDNWGMAVAAGHLVFYDTWKQPGTRIDLVLSGNNFDVSLVAEYTSTKLEKLEDKLKKKQQQDAL